MNSLEVLAKAFDVDLTALREDPYALYDQLRSDAPVWRNPYWADSYVLTRFADCEAVLRDPRWSADPTHRPLPDFGEQDIRTALSSGGLKIMLFADPPDHTRLRRLVSKAFTPRAIEAFRPRIQAIVDGLLDEAAERGELDVIADLGYLVPVTVICEMLGVPLADRDVFGPWSSDATLLLDGILDAETTMRAMGGAMQIIQYLGDLIEDHRAHPRDDLLQAMITAEEQGERLTEEELRINSLLLFVAGHETTMNLIGNGTWALLRHPDQLARWHAEPGLDVPAVEELLRFESPVHLTGRIATTDVEVAGQEFHAGDEVVTLVAAAHRDPDRYAQPNRLDLARPDPHHLAFSYGIHHCLGASLARLEGQIALGTLVRRFPDLELVTDPVEHRDHVVLRGLRELRVRV